MPKVGYTPTAETRRKISEAKKGVKQTTEHRRNLGAPFKGKKHSAESNRKNSEAHKGKRHTEQTKAMLSEASKGEKNYWYGKKFTEGHIKNMSRGQKGKKHSPETRKKIGDAQKGSKNPFWKGGITPINQLIRSSLEYRLWREAVFKRDNYTCVWCLQRAGELNADHIKPFAYFPELRFSIDNGRTLCVECHRTTDTYGSRYKDLLASGTL